MQYKFTLFTKNGISVPSALTQIFSSIEDMVVWLNANVEADTFQLDVASNKIVASSIDGNKYFSKIECIESVDCVVIENCIRNNAGTRDAIRDLVEELLTNDTSIRNVICGIDCTPSPTIPAPVTNVSTTDAGGGAYDCGNPIITWTASSGATSYDVFEGATLLGNTASTSFTVAGASVGSHTYTVVAKNAVGSASGVNVTVNVVACLSAPGNVTGTINVYDSGTMVNYTCGTGFDVDFTDVATATYYQLFEGATQIGSNSSTSNFVITGQSVGSHTYSIYACNGAGCSTGTNFTVNIVACGPTPVFSQTLPSQIHLTNDGNVANNVFFDFIANAHTNNASMYYNPATTCFKMRLTLVVNGYSYSGGNSGQSAIFMEGRGVNHVSNIKTQTNATSIANIGSGSIIYYRWEHLLPAATSDSSYNNTIITECTIGNDFLDIGGTFFMAISQDGGVPPQSNLILDLGAGSKFEIFSC